MTTATLAVDIRVLVGRLRRRMRETASLGDFTLSQSAVLSRLDKNGPSTVTALAEAEGVRPQSMGATVAVLQNAGLIDAAPDPADGRRTILSLSDDARHQIDTGRAAKEDWLSRTIEASLTPAEQKQLAVGVALLQRLVESSRA